MEQWKDIIIEQKGIVYDFTGKYQVSNLGNVRSLNYSNTGEIKMMKPGVYGGYLRIPLTKDGKTTKFLIHRLVANAFIENDDPANKTQVNHKNENPLNNNVNNLEWTTPKENSNYGTRTRRMAKTQSKKVIGYSLTDNKVIILQSSQCAKKFGFNQSAISRCCLGQRKSHLGYKWEYLD